MYRAPRNVVATFTQTVTRWHFRKAKSWPTKSELRYAYYGRNKAWIFNGAIDSANLKKFTIDTDTVNL
jgi:hypothetical protein